MSTEGDEAEEAAGREEARRAYDYIPKDIPIPKLYAQEHARDNAIVWIKLFLPVGAATWYLTEYDPKEDVAFGWVTGLGTDELGYVSLQELREIRVMNDLVRIERDIHWTPTPLFKVKNGDVR